MTFQESSFERARPFAPGMTPSRAPKGGSTMPNRNLVASFAGDFAHLSPLARAIATVEAIAPELRAAESALAAAAEKVRALCGDLSQQKNVEDAARRSVPLPPELRVKARAWITRMIVVSSDGACDRDYTADDAPTLELTDPGAIDRYCDGDDKLRRKLMRSFNTWLGTKSDAWAAGYSPEQKAALEDMRSTQRVHRLALEQMERAIAHLLRIRARSHLDVAVKLECWAKAWGVLSADGQVQADKMDEWDNAAALASIGADLIKLRPKA